VKSARERALTTLLTAQRQRRLALTARWERTAERQSYAARELLLRENFCDESPVVPHPSESRRALSPGKGDDGAETAAVHP